MYYDMEAIRSRFANTYNIMEWSRISKLANVGVFVAVIMLDRRISTLGSSYLRSMEYLRYICRKHEIDVRYLPSCWLLCCTETITLTLKLQTELRASNSNYQLLR